MQAVLAERLPMANFVLTFEKAVKCYIWPMVAQFAVLALSTAVLNKRELSVLT